MRIDINGTGANVEVEEREGALVLFLSHLLACDPAAWDSVVLMCRDDFRVVRYDRREHGKSEATPPPYSLASLATDAISIMDALKIGKAH